MLPPEYLRELELLQDRIPPFPNDQAFAGEGGAVAGLSQHAVHQVQQQSEPATPHDVQPPQRSWGMHRHHHQLQPCETRHAVLAVIAEELGQPVGSVFRDISPEPVAAASLGQVRRLGLKQRGGQGDTNQAFLSVTAPMEEARFF